MSYPEFKTGNGGAEVVAAAIGNTQYLAIGLIIKAASGNSDIVYVGGSGVTILTGFELSAGEELTLEIDDPAKVYVITNPSQNEQQTITYVSGAAGETFQLSFGGETTTELAYDATGATIETAFEALSTVGVGNGTITGAGGGPWTLEFTGDLAGASQSNVTASNIGIDEVQTATYSDDAVTDTYTLTFDGQTTDPLAIDADNAAILAALNNLSNIESGDVVVSGGAAPGTPVVFTFAENLANTDVAAITGSGGTNEVQTITLSSTIAGDTFNITYSGQTTTMIAYDATAETVQVALVALSNITDGDVVVTGADGGPFTLTYGGTLGEQGVAEVTGTAGTNEVQTISHPSDTATGGTWSMDWDGEGPTAVAYNASAATVEAALEAYASITVGDLTVTGPDGGPYVVEFGVNLAQQDVATITADGDLLSGRPITVVTSQEAVAAVDEVQTVTIPAAVAGGTFTLTYDGQTTAAIAYDADAAAVDSALEALSNIGVGDVVVSGVAGAWIVTFATLLAGADIDSMTGDGDLLASHDVTILETQTGGGGVNEEQTISIPASVTGGTFTLTYNGQTTGTIAYNASAATVEAALESLTNIAAGDVSVSGGDGPTNAWVVEFQGNLAGTELVLMGGNGALLSGGYAVTITETVKGVAAVNEKQTITLPTGSNGGTFTVTLDVDPGTAVAWDVSLADLKSDLETNIAAIDTVTVTGTPGVEYVVEFQGGQAGTDIDLMTVDTTSLTGGDPDVTTTTPGHAATFTPATTVAGNTLTINVAETQKGASKSVTIVEAQSASKESKFSWIGQ